jgi:hypothetical protein
MVMRKCGANGENNSMSRIDSSRSLPVPVQPNEGRRTVVSLLRGKELALYTTHRSRRIIEREQSELK